MAYGDNGDDELDYEDEEYPEGGRTYPHQTGSIAALAEEELEEDEYEDLYQDVDVGFFPNSAEAGSQPPARYHNSGQHAEGRAEEDYVDDYEGESRGRPVEDERYIEEQIYRERSQSGPVQAGRDGKTADVNFTPQVYGEGARPDVPVEKKGDEVVGEHENDASKDSKENKEITNAGRQMQGGPETSRAGEYGARGGPSPHKANDERDQVEGDSSLIGRSGSGTVKEESVFPASSQARVDMQAGKAGSGRGSKGPGGAGNWVNGGGGSGGSEPAGSQKPGVVSSSKEGGAWSGRSSGAPSLTASGPGSGNPGNNTSGSNAAANEYGGKHGGSHQHEAGNIMLFVGELHWWTTDAELEGALSEFGRVKNLKFFEEKASGKSKGYCQVEFYEGAAARLCKEKMDGRVFNDRPCVVAFASPQTIKQMGAAQVGKNQSQGQGQSGGQGRGRGESGSGGRGSGGSQMGEGGRGYGREKVQMGGRGQGPGDRGRGSGRGRGGNMTGRGGAGGGAPFQGPPGPMGGAPGGMMPPQGMMGGGFDPAFGPPMGGRGGYGMGPGGPGGGFGPRAHPFAGPGMGPPFPPMGPGLPGVAPHVNPAFFGRANGNGPGLGMDGPGGAWGDGPMPGWVGEEHERRMVYGDEMGGPDYGYPGEMGLERLRPGPTRERGDRGGEGEWVGGDRRRREDRGEGEWERERHRERGERDGYWEREQGREKEKDWQERERTSRPRDKSRTGVEEEERPRSRDEDFSKRRRMVADRKIER